MADLRINNFNLGAFRSLIEESMIVNNQLIMSLSSDDAKCCAMSVDRTLLKMWSVPLSQLIGQAPPKLSKLSKLPTAEDIAEFDNIFSPNIDEIDAPAKPEEEKPKPKTKSKPAPTETLKFDEFDLFVLRAEHFKKFLDVHSDVDVSIDFNFQESDEQRKRAAEIIINSTIDGEGRLSTKYILSTDEMITMKIVDADIQRVIEKMEPTDDMYSVVLNSHQISTVRNMIRSLNKANPINIPYLNIVVDPTKFTINISDTVFNLDYKLSTTNIKTLPKNKHEFSIFKSDFAAFGNHDFTLYLKEENNYVILLNPVIKCVSTFLPEEQTSNPVESGITSLDMDINIDSYFE